MINYAHRGASEYAPENTLSAFYLGLMQGANGIETDVQKTRDGVLVLFHDDTVDRVSDGSGKIADYTWEELRKLKIYGNCTTGYYDRVVTLREFLEKLSQYPIKFAIELKGADVEEETLDMVKEFGVLDKTTFTSFVFDYIKKIKQLDGGARVGLLTSCVDDELIHRLQEIGCEEIAPQAERITAEQMAYWRQLGFGVRAWAVYTLVSGDQFCSRNINNHSYPS